MNLSEHLIARYLPKGVKVKWRTDGNWRPAWTDCDDLNRHSMLSPYPDTPYKSLVFLHECAHIANGDFRHEVALHVQEYQAERTAMNWWRAEGKKVPREYLREAKAYVRECIKSDRKKGKPITAHVARWAKK